MLDYWLNGTFVILGKTFFVYSDLCVAQEKEYDVIA